MKDKFELHCNHCNRTELVVPKNGEAKLPKKCPKCKENFAMGKLIEAENYFNDKRIEVNF